MRTWLVPVRITRTKKCAEGFYLLVNGQRLHFKRKADAVEAVHSLLSMQRIQIVTVREFAERKKRVPKIFTFPSPTLATAGPRAGDAARQPMKGKNEDWRSDSKKEVPRV